MVVSDSLGEAFTQVCITQEPTLWSKVFLLIDCPGLYGYSSLCVESCHSSQVYVCPQWMAAVSLNLKVRSTHIRITCTHKTHRIRCRLWICQFTCFFGPVTSEIVIFISRFNIQWHQLTAEIFLCCNSSHVHCQIPKLCIQRKNYSYRWCHSMPGTV